MVEAIDPIGFYILPTLVTGLILMAYLLITWKYGP